MAYLKFRGDMFTIVLSQDRGILLASYRTVPLLDPMTSPVKVIWPDGHTCNIEP